MSRIAADVGHVDVHILDVKKEVFGILQTHGVVVNVAVDGSQRLEMRQGVSSFDIANITRMPQLVNVLEEVEELWDDGAVCVRQDADFHHAISN